MARSRIQATSITISPDYYRDALSARFGDIPDVCHAFEIVSNRRDFPELVMLLRQIRAYRGNGISADLFYEGTVAEAIALIIARAAEIEILGSESNVAHISAEDRRVIEMLPAYIEQHLSEKLPTTALAHKSCMGLTKFKQCFHAVYGTSPGDYVAGKRIETYIQEHYEGAIRAAYGCSLGGTFVAHLAARHNVHMRYGVIGSSQNCAREGARAGGNGPLSLLSIGEMQRRGLGLRFPPLVARSPRNRATSRENSPEFPRNKKSLTVFAGQGLDFGRGGRI